MEPHEQRRSQPNGHPDPAQTKTKGRRNLTWWDRNEEVAQWVRIHPSTIDLLHDRFAAPMPGNETEPERELRLAKAKKRAYHSLRTLSRQGRIKYHWSIKVRAQGRPIDVFCGWACKMDTIKNHELPLSYFCRAYDKFEWIRGYMRMPEERPDAVGIDGDKVRWVEYDSGEESESQFREKCAALQKADHKFRTLLVVAPTASRVRQLMKWGEFINHKAIYTTLALATLRPKGRIWFDADLNRFSLLHSSEKPSEKPSDKPPE
jgi:hypothetical protein